ncbi:MAG: hypothetical protein F6K22_05555 [Okeania sp. SIO2F4]|uniref:hypothetical protein n=1 Tax=Okeania sp. SIO2F4 TaxID=2607790 RepID=UPI00142AAF6B|nr:hypothetical protein [Okeania sp. SIO2F4]NES02349.1 hypothetical protein [Okeania sp. SIO2F4]
MNKNFQNLNVKSSRFCKHFLKALGGATVSMLSLLSLCLTSAQAASFVTTFETDKGDVTLEWSGSDSSGDGTIDFSELSGLMRLGFGGSTYTFADLRNPYFQPSYCPEVNPIERLWLAIKQRLKWIVFRDLPDLREFLDKILLNINHNFVASLTGWQFIIEALRKVGILENFHQPVSIVETSL